MANRPDSHLNAFICNSRDMIETCPATNHARVISGTCGVSELSGLALRPIATTTMVPQDWLEFDRRHLWHPYTSMTDPLPVYPVVAGGPRGNDSTGRRNGADRWHGQLVVGHPRLQSSRVERRSHRQLEAMSHVMFGGLTHEPAVRLAERLLQLHARGIGVRIPLRLGFRLGGSRPEDGTAILGGVGLHPAAGASYRATRLPWRHLARHERLRSADRHAPALFRHAPATTVRRCAAAGISTRPCARRISLPFAQLLRQHADTIAAVILEPIVQGAGGMRFYAPEYLQRSPGNHPGSGYPADSRRDRDRFGRTGRMFAAEHAQVTPDIMCVGKALTGGYLSLGATLATRRVAEQITPAVRC